MNLLSENVTNRINWCLEEGAEDLLLKPDRPSDVFTEISTRVITVCALCMDVIFLCLFFHKNNARYI